MSRTGSVYSLRAHDIGYVDRLHEKKIYVIDEPILLYNIGFFSINYVNGGIHANHYNTDHIQTYDQLMDIIQPEYRSHFIHFNQNHASNLSDSCSRLLLVGIHALIVKNNIGPSETHSTSCLCFDCRENICSINLWRFPLYDITAFTIPMIQFPYLYFLLYVHGCNVDVHELFWDNDILQSVIFNYSYILY